ncbi:MAG: hypothetical protein LRS49_05940 [Desulfurococcales archaeon]|nr:hypothetical protein [Desulfurococcales archaeon]
MATVAAAVLLAVASAAWAPTAAAMTSDGKIVVLLDLSHGESDKYVNYIVGNLSDIAVFVLLKNATLTPEVLGNVDVVILGQPTASLSSDEIQALIDWLDSGPHVLWIAGDSDYGSGPQVQEIVNTLLEAVGSHLRLETGSVYDNVHNAQRFYRVLGVVNPDDKPEYNTSVIKEGITKPVLYHGPGVVIWVDDQGNCHDLAKEELPNMIRIVWTYDTAYIADNNAPPLTCYDPTVDKNRTFVMLAAEVLGDDIIVASGESPYGDYEPTWSWEYYNVSLDGPRFVSNMISWFKWWIANGGKPLEITTTTTTPTQTATSTATSTQPAGTTTSQAQTTTPTGGAGGQAATTTTTQGKGGNTALIAAAVVIIIIIIAAAALALRR